jgi:AcrR family transcriptional regulator
MKPTRRRRDPEEARGEILDAADRLLVERPPDAVGLADIAREASVSHALVSHYFGTYVGVVDAVLERRRAAVRARMMERIAKADLVDPDELLDALFEALSDRTFVRLSLWALAAERPSASATFPLHSQGMRLVAEAIVERLGDRRAETRRRIEQALVVAGSATLGYVVARGGWMAALGREPSAAFDRSVRRALGEMLRAFAAPLTAGAS